MPDIIDDKSPHVIPFILQRYAAHRASSNNNNNTTPFIIGLNGVQGIGKTTLVESLAATLRKPPNSLTTLTLSIDDFYLPFTDQQALAQANPHNPLLQQRGQPSTHDAALAVRVLAALKRRAPDIKVPAYDKSAHRGRGDRKPEAQWKVVNASGGRDDNDDAGTVDVVIFEGWCVGFRALSAAALAETWRAARAELLASSSTTPAATTTTTEGGGVSEQEALQDERFHGRLGALPLQHVAVVNDALAGQGYEELFTRYLDAFVYLDAEDPWYVYAWRGEQEDELRREKGEASAMSREEVKKFVDGYFPAYEVYVDGVRRGVFRGEGQGGKEGAQMRLVVGRDRSVLKTETV